MPPLDPRETPSNAPEDTLPPATPWQLLRHNGSFTRIWLAQLTSFAGDWIALVALLSLLVELTGSGMSVSLLIVSMTLPSFFLTPLAGVAADRYDRRTLMVSADLLRGFLTLGYLLIHTPDQVWMAYALTVAIVVTGAFFGPASSAAVPNLVRPHQLTAANALSSASWGVMLAVGASIGGLVSTHLGRDTAFAVDAVSFFASALLVLSVRRPFSLQASPGAPEAASLHILADFRESLDYALAHRPILALLLLKTLWGMGGGVLALLSVIPLQVLHAGDVGVGTLYAARGLGALAGPILAHLAARGAPLPMAALAGAGVVVSGLFYTAFSASPTLALAAFFVFCAHLGGGALWVLTTSLLQRFVPDRVLGRIFSLDMGGLTLTMSVSTLLCGWGIVTVGPRLVGIVAGAVVTLVGLGWLAAFIFLRPLRFGSPAR